ncbi:MAG: hypothetical protein P1Q69_08515, partial [Candidatus Thorarchaeota archaeon]|nr:hypothetical protein [Candidatus Thorarchaeota archaeon]
MDDLVCSGCSLLCDDVSAIVEDGEIKSLGLCRLGHVHLTASLAVQKPTAIIRENGKEREVSLEDGLKHASEILKSDETPLLYGWSGSSNETIKEGLLLAESLEVGFHTSTELGARQSMSHDIHKYNLEADLEYARNNGEFIIYWGTDPTESLHRHPSRFAVLPCGDKIPEGVESRTIGVVDVRETETMKMANHRFKIPIGSDVELIESITGELSGASSITGPVLGISPSEVIGFVRGLQKSDCTVIFYGSGVVNSGEAEKNLSAFAKLVETLKGLGKEAYVLPMFPESNTMGVIAATKDREIESGGLHKIMSDETKTVVVVEDDALANLPGPAAKSLASKQIIFIGPPGTLTGSVAAVSLIFP